MAVKAVGQNDDIFWVKPLQLLDPNLGGDGLYKSLPFGSVPFPDFSPLIGRIKQIATHILDFFKDEKWMAMVNELFGAASNLCSLFQAADFLPILSIISAPVYLYHSIQDFKTRFQLLWVAAKTSRIAEGIFQAGRALGSVGSALGDAVKPFMGCAALFGLSQKIPAIGFVISKVIPFALVIFSVIGGVSQGWALARTSKAWQEFKAKRETLKEGSLESLVKFLESVQGPQPGTSAYALDKKNWSDFHFTSEERQEMVSQRIKNLLSIAHELMKRTAKAPRDHLEETLSLSEEVVALARSQEESDPFIKETIDKLAKSEQQLKNLQEVLCEEGSNLTDVMQNEIERKIAEHSLYILAAIIALISALLFLYAPNCQTAAYILSTTSAVFNIAAIVLNKSIPHTYFQHTPAFSKILREKAAIGDAN